MTRRSDTHAARHVKGAREVRRFTVDGIELRSAPDGTGGSRLHLDGYACVTDEPYTVTDWLGEYTEVVKPGSFTRTLNANDDVRLLLNHDGIPLARRRGLDTDTLTLAEDSTGLAVGADLDPGSGLVRDISSAMERGDLDQMSFAFQVTRNIWHGEFPDEQRDIQEVKLFDVSVVTYPANPATSAALGERMQRVTTLLREQRALDVEDVNMLTQALGWLTAIDAIVDQGQDSLADYLGVPDPDPADPGDAEDVAEALRSLHDRLSHRLGRSAAPTPTPAADNGSAVVAAKRRLLAL